MNARPSLAELEQTQDFQTRHIGPNTAEQTQMLTTLGVNSLEQLMQQVIPDAIRQAQPLTLPTGLRESQALAQLEAIAGENRVLRSLIGQGYYNCHTPNVILRNVLENPAWYTAYTPYQPEISQGRLEALLNFQNVVLTAGQEVSDILFGYQTSLNKNELALLLHQHSIQFSEQLNGLQTDTSAPQIMKTYIEQNLTAPLNIANIAAQVHLSNSRAIHLFKETFHMTPYHYYLSRKLAIAQDLLRSTEMSIQEISDLLSFPDYRHFTNLFKRWTGVTPSWFRNDLSTRDDYVKPLPPT